MLLEIREEQKNANEESRFASLGLETHLAAAELDTPQDAPRSDQDTLGFQAEGANSGCCEGGRIAGNESFVIRSYYGAYCIAPEARKDNRI